MKYLRLFRTSFSPYEMAVIGYFIVIVMVIATIGFIVMERTWSSILLLQFLVIFVSCPFWWCSRCPECKKPAGVEYFFRKDSIIGSLERVGFYWTRLWPERQCSNCGHPLDACSENTTR